jgi:hypothetical protein
MDYLKHKRDTEKEIMDNQRRFGNHRVHMIKNDNRIVKSMVKNDIFDAYFEPIKEELK